MTMSVPIGGDAHCHSAEPEDPAGVSRLPLRATAVATATPAGDTGACALQLLLEQEDPASPVSVLHPSAVRWKVDEIESLVSPRLTYADAEHGHVLMVNSHSARPGVHDRLLKVLEESPGLATLWLLHPTNINLPDALRGRGQHYNLPEAALPVLPASLLAAGWSPQQFRSVTLGTHEVESAALDPAGHQSLGAMREALLAGRGAHSAMRYLRAAAALVRTSPTALEEHPGKGPVLTSFSPSQKATLRAHIEGRCAQLLTPDLVTLSLTDEILEAQRLNKQASVFNAPLQALVCHAFETAQRTRKLVAHT